MFVNSNVPLAGEPLNEDICEVCLEPYGNHYGDECPRERAAATGAIRIFDSGATRDAAGDKPEYAGFLSPRVIHAYGQYMHKHRHQSDGTLRPSDNWQKGIPMDVYEQSMWRHFFDVWALIRGLPAYSTTPDVIEACNALLFNVMGYMHETLKERDLVEVNPT